MEGKSTPRQGKISSFFAKKNIECDLKDEDENSVSKKARKMSSFNQEPDDLKDKIQDVSYFDTDIERDPGKRRKMFEFDPSERDKIRHTYLKFGPYQPQLKAYPRTKYNEKAQARSFSNNWFKNVNCESWLEYSLHSDKAYCLYCYLFSTPQEFGGDAFSSGGYNNWKSMLAKEKGIAKHIGGPNSMHNKSNKAAQLLLQKDAHIVNVFEKVDLEMKEINLVRLKLLAQISRHLAVQGLAFRGHNEKEDSLNRGNFLELLELIKGEAPELARKLSKSPKNAVYTSSESQKDFVISIAHLVQQTVRGEIGDEDVPYTILIDEARCAARKEWMALVIRWVNIRGDIQERFLDMIHVKDTSVHTLYDALMSLLLKHNLSLHMIRGQGFDGAANMSGELNGLQSKIKSTNSSAWFVHCWAHKLNLVIVAVCKANSVLCQFFLDVQSIYNIASSSCKRRDMLRDSQAKKIVELLSEGQLSSGSGHNQEMNLQALSTTRWNCQLRSIESLCSMYNSAMEVVEWATTDAADSEKRAEAKSIYERATTFEFILCMFLMKRLLSTTNTLSEYLQKKDQDILNAMRLVRMTKRSIQLVRDEGWQILKAEVVSFCEKNEIKIPSFDDTWIARGRPRRLPSGFESRTIENHYRIELFNVVVDSTLFELQHRFSEDACELLSLIHYMDPSDNFASYKYNQTKILELASIYVEDFKDIDKKKLMTELAEFVIFIEDVENAKLFETVNSDLKKLSQILCQNKLNFIFSQLFKLIRLSLTLPISTATTEQTFSAMKILKHRLRTSMGDEFMVNLMIVYIEKGIAKSLNIDDIVRSFVASTSRRLPIP